ncbi:MAG TPA: DNA topoisomerase IB [Burkholderiales bacterium]|nr:DNA topoisomerase IB [Burkholderiales bacterium]
MDTADPQRGHPRGRLSENSPPRPADHRRAGIKHRRASAASAGLRYVTDDQGGITRKRVGTGWAYYLPDGLRITDRRERKRINSLAIPPAWTQVWICLDPDGHIQATARDARGRKQYRYHPAYRDARDHSKFRHMLEFSEVLPLLRDRIEHDLRAPDHSRRQLLATVVRLLDRTLIRVGNDEYARENKSFGLTTLRRRHVRVNGETLSFTFRGKSGVEHSITLEEPRLARIIQRCQDLPGHELFQYLDANRKRQAISSDDVNAYLRELTGRDVTAKDFRTWGGTMLAAVELRAMGPAASRREADRNVLRAIDAVAERLGNTRAVCRKYYVHPELLRAYLMGVTVPLPEVPGRRRDRRRQREAALRRDEIIVLQFLQERIREPS